MVLAADLLTKALAFEHVADRPLHLSRSPEDGSLVVGAGNGTGPPVSLPRADPRRPASAIPDHAGIEVLAYVLRLKLTANTGAVFGLGKGAQPFFVLVSIAATCVIGRIFWVSPAAAHGRHIALALMLAGALGNLYDRVRFNAVRDMCWLFPDVHLPFGLHWPGGGSQLYPWIFNVADAALLTGVGLMLLLMWRRPRPVPDDRTAPG